jgi:acyl carrier protein
MMGPRDVEDLTIGLLAEEAKCSQGEMRQRLEEADGDDLPIDSILLVEVVVRVEEHCGVHLPTSLETARNLRSVRDFAVMVYNLVQVELARRAGEGA